MKKSKTNFTLNELHQELSFQKKEKEKQSAELVIANVELALQKKEQEKHAAELALANIELSFQNREKEKRASELLIANIELAFQNTEKEKRSLQLTLANAQLIDKNIELETAYNDIAAFSYSVSHDLRTPLRSINGYTKIIEEDYNSLFDEEGKRLLQVVQANATRMGQLIDGLLEYHQLGAKEIYFSEVNITHLVEKVIEEISITNPLTEIKVNNLHPAFCDRSMIEQVLFNYISNSIKFSSKVKRPFVEIKSDLVDSQIIYSISDNGVGFDMSYVNKLFNVFQRLHSNNEFEGTGIGLAIIRRIIGKHEGKVWGKGKIKKGATFYFSLPDIGKSTPLKALN